VALTGGSVPAQFKVKKPSRIRDRLINFCLKYKMVLYPKFWAVKLQVMKDNGKDD
jgi:hypothetical protein